MKGLFRSSLVVALLAASPAAVCAETTITIGGSGTGIAVMTRLGEAFAKRDPNMRFEVPPSLGTAGGIRAVHEGAVDIGFAGREINDAERKYGLKEIPFVNTAFVFMTSNRGARGLTIGAIEAMMRGTKTTWDDGTPARIILRPRADADVAYLAARFPSLAAPYERLRSQREIPVAATDQVTAELAETTVGSLTTGTLLQIISEKRKVTALALEGVEPSLENIESGRYAYARIYYLVVKPAPSAKVLAFLAFIGSAEGHAIVRAAGALPLVRAGQ